MAPVCYNNEVRVHKGQAMLEYVLVLAGLLVVVSIMWGLVRALERQSARTVNIVASDYP